MSEVNGNPGANGATPNGNGASPNDAPLPKRRRKHNNVRLAAIVLAVMVPALYLGFTKDVPFKSGFQVSAVFKTANSIRLDSPVRVAGINVGKVVEVTRYGNTDSAKVTMEFEETGLPIHSDAQLKIRPRIFLEGNFFVDLAPGTPTAPVLEDGDVIPVTQTSTPVQLDQVLTSLQYNTRGNLQTLLREIGVALDTKPTAAEDAVNDPEVRGLTAGQALNKSLDYTAKAEKGQALVNQGLLGVNKGDLAGFIRGLAKTTTALGKNEQVLADFITNFNGTLEGLGSNQKALSQAIGLLGPTVTDAYKALGSLDESLPALSNFSLALIPAVEQTQATADAGIPWANAATKLLSPEVLGRTIDLLAPITVNTAQTVTDQIKFLPETRALSQCFAYKILPTGDTKIVDGPSGSLSTNQEAYKAFWFALVGQAGESQNFDGNGQFLRALAGGSTYQNAGDATNPADDKGGHLKIGPVEMTGPDPGDEYIYGNLPSEQLGTSPRYFGRASAPDYKPNQRCIPSADSPVNAPVDLNDPVAAKGAADPSGSPAG
ncbi:MAG: MlaD family protein [Actinomycetes bacterium]